MTVFYFYSEHIFLAHQIALSSINFPHFDLLLKNNYAKLVQTWMWHFWNGPLFEFVSDDLVLHPRWLPWLLIGWKIRNLWKSYFSSEPLHRMRPNLVQIVLGWSPSKLCLLTLSIIQDDHHGWKGTFWFSSIILSFWPLI